MHPREFGKYRIVKMLPLGGMGRVYLALDTAANREVALKLIEHGPDRASQEIVDAEHRGAILQARLCGLDPHVTIIHEYGDLDGFFYIEMEYVEGDDLSEVLHKGPLGVPFALRIAVEVCEVLQTAHTFSGAVEDYQYHGIVHGDIKPRNIRLRTDGLVKVLDFGIAKALSLTRKFTQNQFGSVQYGSPERLNTGDVDVSSDLWSVAVVLFEMITGSPYFQAESVTRLEHIIRTYSVVRPFPESVPVSLRKVLAKALAADVTDRYQTAAEFLNDLKALQEGRPAKADAIADVVAGGISDDGEATRRTGRAAVATDPDEAKTRRTVIPGARSATAPVPAAKTSVAARKSSPMRNRVKLGIRVAAVLLLALAFFNEYSAADEAAALKHDLQTQKLTDMNQAWERYEALAQRSYLPGLLSSTRDAIKQKMIESADRVITEYRESDAPNVTEPDWQRARATLARALEIAPDDKNIRGKLFLCDGHIQRIRASGRNQAKLNQPKLWSEARADFEQARDLMPKSPDAYLGLARVYIYGLHDVEKGEEALKGAERHGLQPGKREKAQLADGFRERADLLFREALRSQGQAEELDYLYRSEQDYRRAQDLYQQIVPFSGSATSVRKVRDSLDTIAARRQTLKDAH
jgi:tetratricopeptide (TPR) repeat protein